MLAGKGRVTSTVCSTPFALWESSSEPRSVRKILGSYRDTPCVLTCISDLGATGPLFLSGGDTEVVRPSISLNIHPIAFFFLLIELALLLALAFRKPGGAPPLLSWGLLDPSMALDPLRHTPAASFPMGRTVLT